METERALRRSVGGRSVRTVAGAVVFAVSAVAFAPDSLSATTKTTRVSVRSNGAEATTDGPADPFSFCPSISADGRVVAFSSLASNLVPDDNNEAEDVFVHNRRTGKSTRVSVRSNGKEATRGPNGPHSSCPSISSDGRVVAFESEATDLVEGDNNGSPDGHGGADVFVHNRRTGKTTRVSVSSTGSQGNGDSTFAAISGDGRVVAFQSEASNLVAGDDNNAMDVFVHNRRTGRTTRVSVDSSGGEGNADTCCPSISADGRVVAFRSDASDLVEGDTNNAEDIFVHNRRTGRTKRVSVATDGGEANGFSDGASISADKGVVAFDSGASNLVGGDDNNRTDVFVHNRRTGRTKRVSVATDGGEANHGSSKCSISADGRFVAISSRASNLVQGDHNDSFDVFVHDRRTDKTKRVSVASDGREANDHSLACAISADGRFVAFQSSASNLVTADNNNADDIFVRGALR